MNYLKPEMEILILQQDVITMSEGNDDGNTPSVDYGDWFPQQ